MKRVLLIGRNGQVGYELERELTERYEVVATDRSTLDVADLDAIRSAVRGVQPDVIVNAAAYTAVDRAESEPGLARRVNAEAPRVLAEEAAAQSALLVHYSTDYVFDGTKATPYEEQDPTSPLNVYGQTKLEGEEAIRAVGSPHLILRTSWVYGQRGHNFLQTMLRLGAERPELRIVSDQRGCPTWSASIAEATSAVLDQWQPNDERGGTYHLSAEGETSWHGFAEAIFSLHGPDKHPVTVVPISTDEYPTPARRPRYSVLSKEKLRQAFGIALPDWRTALSGCLQM